jgi:hypothetical protein
MIIVSHVFCSGLFCELESIGAENLPSYKQSNVCRFLQLINNSAEGMATEIEPTCELVEICRL